MDARELKELLNAVLEHKDAEQLFKNITFIISYLISEQKKREALSNKLEQHASLLTQFDKDMILTKHTIEKIEASSKSNNKMLRAILAAVVAGIIIEGVKMLFHK